MESCCVCRKPIPPEDSTVLFVGENEEAKEICPQCREHFDALLEGENPGEMRTAVNYLYTCGLSSTDEEVLAFLEGVIEKNSPAVLRLEEEQAEESPVDTSVLRDYFADKEEEKQGDRGGSGWITGLRVIAWLSFSVILIGGIVGGAVVGEYDEGSGALIFFLSLSGAFVTVAGLMVFLKMAEDISAIRAMLKERRK